MLITRIELENIKSYRSFAVDFRRGATAISGANGAGKTTLVEAIGYALFDFLPYKNAQFVREGEKYGQIVVHLIGSDDRPYTVERRCGSGAHWFIYDREADSRSEQRIDVLDKLHDIFGIDRERSLETLFQDALGVPQGTFTAIFLQTPSLRKQTFDTLLQIEDYKVAADYLLEVQKQYREQIQGQSTEIQRLEFETRDLENWQTALKEERNRDQQQTAQIAQWSQELEQAQARSTILIAQRDELIRLRHQHEQSVNTHRSTQQRLTDRFNELQNAQQAQQAVESSQNDHQYYLKASDTLQQLRKDEKQRNDLRKQQSGLQTKYATLQATLSHLQERLAEVARARQRIIDLLPLVETQTGLEKRRDELIRQSDEYDRLVKEGQNLKRQRDAIVLQIDNAQQSIAAIEPLQAVAAQLQERDTTVNNLRIQMSKRDTHQHHWQEKSEQFRLKLKERDEVATRLRDAEQRIALIEAHRQEAETLPVLQQQREQCTEQRSRLQGSIDGFMRSRKQSAGGLCPFLQEPCLNIKQRGVASLEFYFDGLLKDERSRLAEVQQQQQGIDGQIAAVQKYYDALGKLGQYVERRDNLVDQLQHIAVDIGRLERERGELAQELEALKSIDLQINAAVAAQKESKDADNRVRKLEGLRIQVQQFQEQLQQFEIELQERREQVKVLHGCKQQLEEVKAELQKLNDPRGETRAQHEIIKQEQTHQQLLQANQQKLLSSEQELGTLQQQLATYAELDKLIAEQEVQQQRSVTGYRIYLANEQNARLLPQRELAYQEIARAAELAQQAMAQAEQKMNQAAANFRQEDLDAVSQQISHLHGSIKELAETIRHTQITIKKLEKQIEQAEALLVELEAAQKEKATLEELQTMVEMFRKLIKEAGPHVLKAMLNDISAEANRIFGEIMGDRTAQLAWQNEYEITLRRQSVNRTFAQLSGGEQMSAALAVRLALLKKLSTLNIAFFDEPTQNMDELRRMNLAEQIRRVRGFDQLIVISHDDTFEQGLDSIIRLRKQDGETRLLSEDDATYGQNVELSRVEQHAS